MGRYVDRPHFRVYVYSTLGKKLVNSYEEYCDAIESGKWFSNEEDVRSIPGSCENVSSIRKKRNKETQK